MSRAEAEHEPPAADLVDRLDRLGGDAWVAVESGQDPRADLDPRGRGRDGAGHGDALPEPLRRSIRRAATAARRPPRRCRTRSPRRAARGPGCRPPRRGTVDEHVPHRENEADLERAHRTSGSGSCVLLACDHPARRSLDGQGHPGVRIMRAARRCVAARAYDATEWRGPPLPPGTQTSRACTGIASHDRSRSDSPTASALHNAGPRLRAAGSRCVPGAVNGHPRDRWTCGR